MQFVFAGNRFFVLEAMLEMLDVVEIMAVPGSYLERELDARGVAYTPIASKKHLISVLQSTQFDYFLANGCPHILPISSLAHDGKRFLNVHPSPLPDLRGADPVVGALLHGRDGGATCHVMNDEVDAGPIISRVVIPNTEDLDAALLYQLSFLAEKEAFQRAYERSFEPSLPNEASEDSLYYTKHPSDLDLNLSMPSDDLIRRTRAFSNRSQGARLRLHDSTCRVFDAQILTNPYLMARTDAYEQNEVVFRYEDSLVIRHGAGYVHFRGIEGDLGAVRPGDILPAHAPTTSEQAP